MIGRQRATPPKGIRFSGLPWAEVEAGHGLSTPIVDRVAELDGATLAVGCNVNGCRIDDNDGSTTGQPLDGCGTHAHINFRDVKRRGRRTLARWHNQWRSQLIGTGHLDTAKSRVRMVDRQRATPRKCIRFCSLSWIEVETGWSLSTPIVDRVTELNGAPGAFRRHVEESRIGHGHVRTAGYARD